MTPVRVTTVDAGARRELAAAATEADGFPSLGENVWRDVVDPTPESFDVVAERDGRLQAILHVFPGDSSRELHRAAGLVVAPGDRDPALVAALFPPALEQIGGEAMIVWLPGTPEYATKGAAAAGLEHQRDLHRMEVALPLDEAPRWPPGVELRTFRVGDEDEWLRVNNRAFAGHPEQSGWTAATLRRRIEEPWFEAEGFLLAVADDGLAGFCWTKRHAGAVGEIYVIGVDPEHQGGGLGRSLVVAGLASLAGRGASIGMLYVDGANRAAVELYESLGFEIVRTDAAYRRAAR